MAGIDHPDMLMTTSELGSVLGYQGKYQKAEVMNRQVLASYEKGLRANHPMKLAAMNNLASALMGSVWGRPSWHLDIR
ncbi:hypothetical protein IFM61392_03802 [Aspergillus lentulus]|nr:hypothetical protein IFM62136_01305 [Aspergillus lentulus]GFG05380.1 hypothetical protein IFM61392_03802 [Aspergillus lentulus]